MNLARRQIGSAWIAVLGFAMLLAGCSATAPGLNPNPSPSASATVVIPGTPLSTFVENGPRPFSLPDVSPLDVIDQPNVVTLILTPSDGKLTHDHLLENLEAMGFEIIGTSSDSLVFENPGWEGALTTANELSALTLRRS